MNDILETLRTVLAERSRDLPDDDFRLRGMWCVDYRSQPTEYERFMAYSFVLAQTVRQGCCYADFGTVRLGESSDGLIGKDARLARGSSLEEDIAILDAAFGALPRTPAETLTIDGRPEVKALTRARTAVGETMRLLTRVGGRKVAQIGVMGNLIHHLRQEDVEITASDFDPCLIENGILGVPVSPGEDSARLVAESDVALVCGETLASRTLGELVAAAAEHDTRLVVFAVTGCHFAQEYCGTFGIDTVMAEPQPQYLFQGPSTLEIYRKDALGAHGQH
ncbi:Rossmann-like domain-containing protein [Streptomyces sp. NPDC021093]|uniref:Rossmann-like domain-containing protein n=1 Tax=Streptomyces sp. NPDC021093 TaxID=3365112 RepID=UPI003790E225